MSGMSDIRPVSLSTQGPGETVLPNDPAELVALLAAAHSAVGVDRRAQLASAAARFPRSSRAWAELAETAADDIERYAYYRVGYHRGLDALRANGWRGSGYVRWAAPANHGFLRSLVGLAQMAERIGELDEAERCATFLAQCDPSGPPM
jgi:hypothetical protein